MAAPKITPDRLRDLFVYEPESGLFTRRIAIRKRPAGTTVGSVGGRGYISMRVDGGMYTAHRLAWLYVHGEWPAMIDHINGDKTDNRIANLRQVTASENNQNWHRAMPTNKSGILGVSLDRRRPRPYRAQIQIGEKRIHLGCFVTADAAHAAYMNAKRELHPAFVALIPDEAIVAMRTEAA